MTRGERTKDGTKYKRFCLTLHPAIATKLEKVSKEEGRSRSGLIAELIRKYRE